tara:strand:- start:1587 stop:2126 length:540 start_codon:yes stop_codon:yes gene_type:complete
LKKEKYSMKKNFLILGIVCIVFFFFVVFYLSLDKQNTYEPNIVTNKKIETFTAKKLFEDGQVNSVNLFNENKVYLLNIWASWCLPCQKEHKYLMKLKNDHFIDIIGLNYKDKLLNARKFIEELGNPYEVSLRDKDGTIAILFGAYGLPETYVIKDKKIIKKYIGPIDNKSIKEILSYTK